jgi:hypothetical protein
MRAELNSEDVSDEECSDDNELDTMNERKTQETETDNKILTARNRKQDGSNVKHSDRTQEQKRKQNSIQDTQTPEENTRLQGETHRINQEAWLESPGRMQRSHIRKSDDQRSEPNPPPNQKSNRSSCGRKRGH